MKKIIIISFLLIANMFFSKKTLLAQNQITASGNIISSQIESPPLVLANLLYSHSFENLSLYSGLSLNLNKPVKTIVNQIKIGAKYRFFIKEKDLGIDLFYRFYPVSNIINNHLPGVLIDWKNNNWNYTFGVNHSIFKFNKNYLEEISYTENTILVESFNFLYSIKYFFLRIDNVWDFYANISNYNFYSIEQETNPMFNLGATYKTKGNGVNLFADFWYQSAGLFNIRVNYFCVLFRTGLIWEFD